MMQSLMYMFLLIFTFIFSFMKHPLAMGFMLLIQTLLICMITGLMNESFWFSYILFLVFLGGMLVLFIYVISLASNEMFNFSFKIMFLSLISLTILILISLLLLDNMKFYIINNNDLMNLEYYNIYTENFKSIYKLYNFPTNLISLLLINYLFFTLVIVVKITNFYYGPLRNMI